MLIGSVPPLIETLNPCSSPSPRRLPSRLQRHQSPAPAPPSASAPISSANHHVLFPLAQKAITVTAELGYETDANEVDLAPTPLPCDVATIQSDPAHDWGVIRTAAPMSAAVPTFDLTDLAAPVAGARAFLLHHPGGGRKRVGFLRNQIVAHDALTVHYLTDTQQGSSGSPVLDAAGRLIALHRAGGLTEVAGGNPCAGRRSHLRARSK
ncbi:MAG: serine protease [Polyangiaceae bacterium]